MGRIDYRSGFILAAATAPGAVLGALTSDLIPRRTFDALFGVALIVACAFLLLRRARGGSAQEAPAAGDTHRHVVDAEGRSYKYSFNMKIGVALSAIVGYVSSFLGIGGGIIHVPALALVLNFPVHLATATSHFILAMMALAGTLTHVATGSFSHGGVNRTIVLAVGTLFGAPLGARLSNRIRGRWIIRALAVGLGSVGIRILMLAFE